MLWLYILYILIGVGTMFYTIRITCVYNNKPLSEGDIASFVLVSFLFGLLWPMTWVYGVFMGFAKRIYEKSVQECKKAEDLRREKNRLARVEDDKLRARMACSGERPKSTRGILEEARLRQKEEYVDPVINLYDEDSTIMDPKG